MRTNEVINRIFIRIDILIRRFKGRFERMIITMSKTSYESCVKMGIKDLETLLRDKDHIK